MQVILGIILLLILLDIPFIHWIDIFAILCILGSAMLIPIIHIKPVCVDETDKELPKLSTILWYFIGSFVLYVVWSFWLKPQFM